MLNCVIVVQTAKSRVHPVGSSSQFRETSCQSGKSVINLLLTKPRRITRRRHALEVPKRSEIELSCRLSRRGCIEEGHEIMVTIDCPGAGDKRGGCSDKQRSEGV